MANSYTKTYVDGTALFEADLDAGLGSVQPTLSNLALSTTGSSAADILVSTGSNVPPAFHSPNTVASTITSVGANLIFGVVSSCQASVANLILTNVTSCTSAVSNIIVGQLNSCQASVANLIAQSVTRSSATSVGLLGIAFGSSTNATVTLSNTLEADIPGLSVDITTSGRPVSLGLTGLNAGGSLQFQNSSVNGIINCYRTVGTVSTLVGDWQFAVVVGSIATNVTSCDSVRGFDLVAAGTYNYKISAYEANGGNFILNNVRLFAYEL